MNLALEQANCWRPGRKSSPGPAARQRQLTEARQDSWLAEGSSSVQQQALRDFDRAMQNFFVRPDHFGFPTWRKAGINEGFCVRDVRVKCLNRKWASLVVPKAGPVRFRLSRALPATFGMARITLDRAGRWHVSFTATPSKTERKHTGAVVGIDRGVTTTLATTDGQMLRIPTSSKLEAKVVRLQQQISRKVEGSKQRDRAKARLGRTKARITDRRRNWIEVTTTKVVADYDVIVLERLDVRSMLRSPKPKPDPERPGQFLPNGKRAKAGLNRGIARSCWGLFLRRLQEKAAAAGVEVVLVDPAYTSLQCRRCGHSDKANRESQAEFRCVGCGHRQHADLHAAENILARGLVEISRQPGVNRACARISRRDLVAAGTSGLAA